MEDLSLRDQINKLIQAGKKSKHYKHRGLEMTGDQSPGVHFLLKRCLVFPVSG